jgi:hypothetical protein
MYRKRDGSLRPSSYCRNCLPIVNRRWYAAMPEEQKAEARRRDRERRAAKYATDAAWRRARVRESIAYMTRRRDAAVEAVLMGAGA